MPMRRAELITSAVMLLAAALLAAQGQVELRQEAMTLRAEDGGQPRAIYYYPAGQSPKIAFVNMHPRNDNSQYFNLKPLAARGFGALGMAPRNIGGSNVHEELLLDVAAGVSFLRKRGVRTVILIGHSGGGSLFAFYQAQAETAPPNRVKQTPAGDPTDLNRFDLPKADGMILVNAVPAADKLRAARMIEAHGQLARLLAQAPTANFDATTLMLQIGGLLASVAADRDAA